MTVHAIAQAKRIVFKSRFLKVLLKSSAKAVDNTILL